MTCSDGPWNRMDPCQQRTVGRWSCRKAAMHEPDRRKAWRSLLSFRPPRPSARQPCACGTGPQRPWYSRYQSTNRGRPSSIGVFGSKPRSRRLASMSAQVRSTSRGGRAPARPSPCAPSACSRTARNRRRCTGWWLPRLSIACGLPSTWLRPAVLERRSLRGLLRDGVRPPAECARTAVIKRRSSRGLRSRCT